MNYIIQARVGQRDRAGQLHVREIPTFTLDGDFLGITSPEHAISVAASVLNPFSMLSLFNVTAVAEDWSSRKVAYISQES